MEPLWSQSYGGFQGEVLGLFRRRSSETAKYTTKGAR